MTIKKELNCSKGQWESDCVLPVYEPSVNNSMMMMMIPHDCFWWNGKEMSKPWNENFICVDWKRYTRFDQMNVQNWIRENLRMTQTENNEMAIEFFSIKLIKMKRMKK